MKRRSGGDAKREPIPASWPPPIEIDEKAYQSTGFSRNPDRWLLFYMGYLTGVLTVFLFIIIINLSGRALGII
jgi:hypothetical protein